MNIKASVYIATSLDGFIAREDGNLDWLDNASKLVPKDEDCGYNSFFNSVDALIMGRKTFEKVLSFGSWPYESKKVIVLSKKGIEIPNELEKSVTLSSESPTELCLSLEKEGLKKLYIDGGVTIQSFLKNKLIDEMILTIIPIILGKGVPLFSNLENDYNLKLLETKSYDFGFVQLTYKVDY